MKKNKKSILDYMWILSITYLILGFFNILFAWLGLLCFLIPIIISILGGGKSYCNIVVGDNYLTSLAINSTYLEINQCLNF